MGDPTMVRQRRERGSSSGRALASVQALLSRLEPAPHAPIEDAELEADGVAATATRGIVPKTASKVATDLHTWDLFVREQKVQLQQLQPYPSTTMMLKFASFCTRHRERACLAQRDEGAPRLEGKVRTTVRNMMTELIKHAWPCRWRAFAALSRQERCLYETEVLEQVRAKAW